MIGIKGSKPGKNVSTSELKDLLLHSSFSMFKYHMDTIQTMTINAGETSKSISFAHNLGYVPAFIGYMENNGLILPLPNRRVPAFTGQDENYYMYADSSNIYICWKSALPYNQTEYAASDYWNTRYGDNLEFSVGRSSNNPFSGALRFTGISLSGSDGIYSAKILAYVTYKSGSGDIKFKTYGINEDNTSSFNDPMGRPKTTAYSSNTRTVPTNNGDIVEIDVKNAMLEIADRSGWSSGNAMGFIVEEDSGASDAYFGSYSDTILRIIKDTSVTLSFRVVVFKDKIA